ncbi:tRNA (guanine(37)-N(1))-methyltransferase [Oncorhynchus kisutch]|uniref:tRNA (guanine(37)-N(1))-methyltransferase n=1 Tax=Oncorhynchus kisutch TaxID=8019 RepID=UPI0009A02BE6|nr:tRNA (guanine(37)-N1)-methyltransferase-like [Oncorhynchus kisutch]
MNLREHQLPYRNLIGQVIMDKNPWVTCVVNKTNTIDSTYRFFKMVMVGEENMVAKKGRGYNPSLGVSLEGQCSVHLARNVAPNREMSVTFTIPKEVLFSSKNTHRNHRRTSAKETEVWGDERLNIFDQGCHSGTLKLYILFLICEWCSHFNFKVSMRQS